MVGDGGGKGNIRMVGEAAAEGGVLDDIEKAARFASFEAKEVEKERHAIWVANGVKGEEEEPKFSGSLPRSALGKVLDVSPAT